jgi:thioredoxin-related protein
MKTKITIRFGSVLGLLSLLIFATSYTTPEPVESIKWMTFEEAVQKMKTEKRKIFIDVYTDWCGWCKKMDKSTFLDPAIAKKMNEEFYAVKFNAEQKEDVVFEGKTFKYVESGRGGYHQLAAALLNNQLSYPNFVFLNEEFHIVPVIPGYGSLPGFQQPDKFHFYLSYVGDDHYKSMKPDDYGKIYQSPYSAPSGVSH